MLQNQYLKKAQEAFHAREFKKTLILLSKFTEWDDNSVSVLVESAYLLWSQIQQRVLVEHFDKQLEDDDVLNTVHLSFQRLLSGSIPKESIRAFDFIRLSHVYIMAGNLMGALDVMKLASARGHLENILIVVQSWLLLKRLKQQKEAANYQRFMISSVTLLGNQVKMNRKKSVAIYAEKSNLPLGSIYLLCCLNLLKDYAGADERNVFNDPFELSFLVETYSVIEGGVVHDKDYLIRWLLATTLWINYGEILAETPFLLLSEEFFWKAFLIDPIKGDLPLSCICKIMNRTGRSFDIPQLMAKAYKYCPWNIFCRTKIIAIELESGHSSWTALFGMQYSQARDIQKVVRGYRLRRQWMKMRDRLKEITNEHHKKMLLSDEKAEEYRVKLKKKLIIKWKIYLSESKALKKKSSTLLQAHFRRFIQGRTYKKLHSAMSNCNSKYLQLVYMQFEVNRLYYFKHWFNKYFEIRRRQSANIIADVLLINGYNQVLVKGMDMFLGIVRIHRHYVAKRLFSVWMLKYLAKKKRTAKYTIRFFIRSIYSKLIDRAHEQKLETIERMVNEKQQVTFEHKNTPLLREMWFKWRKLLTEHRNHRAKMKMVLTLQGKYYCAIAKSKVNHLKIRTELQTNFVLSQRMNKLYTIMVRWRILAAHLKIQRCVRCYLSKKRLWRLLAINKELTKRIRKKVLTTKLKCIHRWKIYKYMCSKESKRRREVLQMYFKSLKFRWLLSVAVLRTIHISKFSILIDKASKKLQFRNFKIRSKVCFFSKKIHGLCSVLYRLGTLNAFRRWKLRDKFQNLIRKKISSLLYCSELPMIKYKLVDGTDYRLIFHMNRWKWMNQQRKFYRIKFAKISGVNIWNSSISHFVKRCIATNVLQRFYRNYCIDNRKRSELRRILRIIIERRLKFHGSNLLKIFTIFLHMAQARAESRTRLQRFVRKSIQSGKYSRKDYRSPAKVNLEAILSLKRRNFISKIFNAWLILFLKRNFHADLGTKVIVRDVNRIPLSERSHRNYQPNERNFTRRGKVGIKIMKAVPSSAPFQSELFHKAIHQLRSSGTFIYDRNTKLFYEEIEYIVLHCGVIFLNEVDERILHCIGQNFLGTKIIFHGGYFNETLVETFLEAWCNSCPINENNSAVSLQLLDVRFNLASIRLFARMLLKMNNIKNRLFHEIQVSASIASNMGILLLLSSLKVMDKICTIYEISHVIFFFFLLLQNLNFLGKLILYVDGEDIPYFSLAFIELSKSLTIQVCCFTHFTLLFVFTYIVKCMGRI